MKAGLTAAKAVPLVNAGMIVGGAIHGAITAKPGERMAGAAKGAWDMSLPGMVVNTGLAAKQAIQGRVSSPSPVSPTMTAPARFAHANTAYQAMQNVGLGKARHVWDDKARAIALEVRRAKAAAKAP